MFPFVLAEVSGIEHNNQDHSTLPTDTPSAVVSVVEIEKNQTKAIDLLQACNNSNRQRLFRKWIKRIFLVYKEKKYSLHIDFFWSIYRFQFLARYS